MICDPLTKRMTTSALGSMLSQARMSLKAAGASVIANMKKQKVKWAGVPNTSPGDGGGLSEAMPGFAEQTIHSHIFHKSTEACGAEVA